MRVEEAYNAHGMWPSAEQELLLRAALGRGADAQAAFDAWHACLDLERLDGGSVRLLPLLYRNLVDEQIPVPNEFLDRLRGVYRQSWYKNQMLVSAVARVLQHFAAAGVPAIVLKGVPLALDYYPTSGARPMTDADILVPAERAAEAYRVALAAGLVPKFDASEWPPRFTASKPFVDSNGWELDLHTNLMHECRGVDRDRAIWASAVPIEVGGVPTLTLAPEHHLVHIIAHGIWRNALPPIRWVADAAVVVRRRGGRIDWELVGDEARDRRFSLAVGRALRYLKDRMGMAIPERVLARMAKAPRGVAERFEYQARMMSGATGLAATRMSDYLRARGREPDWQGPLGIVHYVRDTWALPSSWLVPVAAYWKSVRRITGRTITKFRIQN